MKRLALILTSVLIAAVLLGSPLGAANATAPDETAGGLLGQILLSPEGQTVATEVNRIRAQLTESDLPALPATATLPSEVPWPLLGQILIDNQAELPPNLATETSSLLSNWATLASSPEYSEVSQRLGNLLLQSGETPAFAASITASETASSSGSESETIILTPCDNAILNLAGAAGALVAAGATGNQAAIAAAYLNFYIKLYQMYDACFGGTGGVGGGGGGGGSGGGGSRASGCQGGVTTSDDDLNVHVLGICLC